MGILQTMRLKYLVWDTKRQYKKIEDEKEFIFGIKDRADMTKGKADLFTWNDFDVIRDRRSGKYSMGVETFIGFYSKEDSITYFNELLKDFTGFMEKEGLQTNRTLEIWDIFTDGVNINSEFDSLEDAYAAFKFLVKGYENN